MCLGSVSGVEGRRERRLTPVHWFQTGYRLFVLINTFKVKPEIFLPLRELKEDRKREETSIFTLVDLVDGTWVSTFETQLMSCRWGRRGLVSRDPRIPSFLTWTNKFGNTTPEKRFRRNRCNMDWVRRLVYDTLVIRRLKERVWGQRYRDFQEGWDCPVFNYKEGIGFSLPFLSVNNSKMMYGLWHNLTTTETEGPLQTITDHTWDF